MKSKIISTLKFVGLHALIGVLWVVYIEIEYRLKYSVGIEFFSNIYDYAYQQFNNVHLFEWILVAIPDTLMTLAIKDNFSIFKGRNKTIKSWFAWILGILISNYSADFAVLLAWLI